MSEELVHAAKVPKRYLGCHNVSGESLAAVSVAASSEKDVG